MHSRFLRSLVYVLLALLPLQGIAAANMLVCNSLMQQAAAQAEMPCHQEAGPADGAAQTHDQHVQQDTQPASHSSCGMLCNSLCGLTALPVTTFDFFATSPAVMTAAPEADYHSITLPQLQRPPISLA